MEGVRTFMTLNQLEFVVEIARVRSSTKAAESLCLTPSNLSRSLRELERELGFAVFARTKVGMVLTPEGEELVERAQSILNQVQNIEDIAKREKQQFRISVPRASYISYALTRFASALGGEPVEIDYKETNSMRALDNLMKRNYNLAIVRYQRTVEANYLLYFQEHDYHHEVIADFRYQLLFSSQHALAAREEIHFSDLAPYTEITHGDPYVPSHSHLQAKLAESLAPTGRHIQIYERGSQFDLLCDTPDVYMWASPVPEHILGRYDLVSRECCDAYRTYRDVLVYPRQYRLRSIDRLFLTELQSAAAKLSIQP